MKIIYEDILKYLKDLISFKSITPNSDGSIEYIADLLASKNFIIDIKEFGDDLYSVKNLYAKIGQNGPNICFVGHVDVVPTGDLSLWLTDPFSMTLDNGLVYGRGVVDMKGAIACMLAASINFIDKYKDFNGSISFLLTTDEEGDAIYGIKEMIKYLYNNKLEKIDLAIVGEPTNDKIIGDTIKIGRRGSINFNLVVQGEQGHVAYKELSKNPIDILVNIASDLLKLEIDQGNDFFAPSSLTITSIDTFNNATNVIPASSSMKFNIRFNNIRTSESIIETIESAIKKHHISYQLSYKVSAQPFLQASNAIIKQFIMVVESTLETSSIISTSGGTSDARFIKDYCSVVEFGLKYNLAHKINEHTTIIDLQKLCNVYYKALESLLIEK